MNPQRPKKTTIKPYLPSSPWMFVVESMIIVSAICHQGLKPLAIINLQDGKSPIGATDNSPAIYCRVAETMIKAVVESM